VLLSLPISRATPFLGPLARGDDHLIRTFRGKSPQIASTAYVDPQAVLIGDVTLAEDASVWPCAVLRGDVLSIRIGVGSNVQDGSVFHTDAPDYPLLLGDYVTVGHGAILHGCTVEAHCLIGMGSIILNGAKIGTGSIVAAGTLVPERTVIPPGSLVMGVPGKVRRALSSEEIAKLAENAKRYVERQKIYRSEAGK
jgi:gamma-carbonic anhydrase